MKVQIGTGRKGTLFRQADLATAGRSPWLRASVVATFATTRDSPSPALVDACA